jgi:hypothetical protein
VAVKIEVRAICQEESLAAGSDHQFMVDSDLAAWPLDQQPTDCGAGRVALGLHHNAPAIRRRFFAPGGDFG